MIIPISITIADRTYRVKIEADKEPIVREVIALFNKKIIEFRQIYAGKDMQDFVSMVLLWFVMEQMDIENNTLVWDNIYSTIEKIEHRLETLVNKEPSQEQEFN